MKEKIEILKVAKRANKTLGSNSSHKVIFSKFLKIFQFLKNR